MRENIGLYRGKRDNLEWVKGYYAVAPVIRNNPTPDSLLDFIVAHWIITPDGNMYSVDPETVGQFTGLTDNTKWEYLTQEEQSDWLKYHTVDEWKGKPIFEGDILRYNTYNDFECYSIVKQGEYKQDGSGGEYSATKCIGFYVDVHSFICPDWADNDHWCFNNHLNQQNLLEVAKSCVIIGNVSDNFEYLQKAEQRGGCT